MSAPVGSMTLRRVAAALAIVGSALLGLGLVAVALSAPATAAPSGANFVATGHDMDLHCAGGATDECAYLKIVNQKVRNGSTLPVLALDHGTQVEQAAAAAGISPVTTVDPDDAAAFNAVAFTTSAGKPRFSAIIVASDQTCGGCDNTATSITDINARAADFKTFFNGGGGILALAGAERRDTYYDFVPLKGLMAAAVSPPFTVTSKGASLGVTAAMANCCATHNSFELPTSPLVSLETDSASLAETIAALNVSIGGGGFTSPPPSSSAASSTSATARPSRTTVVPPSASATSGVAGVLSNTGVGTGHGGIGILLATGIGLLGTGLVLARFGARPRRAGHRAG